MCVCAYCISTYMSVCIVCLYVCTYNIMYIVYVCMYVDTVYRICVYRVCRVCVNVSLLACVKQFTVEVLSYCSAQAAFFQEERDIMAWSTSPWLTSLTYAFMDSKCLYLVMEFHPGGDLLTVMEKDVNGEILTEQGIIFYLVEITAALNDLHQLGFVHRLVKCVTDQLTTHISCPK